MLEIITTPKAPKAVGPYSQAVKYGNFIFCSGQVSIDPITGKIMNGTISEQTRRALDNIKAVLEAAGSDLDHVLKTTVYLSDMKNFQEMNEVYASYFKEHFPARLTVEVKSIFGGLGVEIEAIAVIKESKNL